MFGTYFFITGVGLITGHYENPFTVLELIRYGEIYKVSPLFYAYFGSSIVLYCVGIFFQYRKLKQVK